MLARAFDVNSVIGLFDIRQSSLLLTSRTYTVQFQYVMSQPEIMRRCHLLLQGFNGWALKLHDLSARNTGEVVMVTPWCKFIARGQAAHAHLGHQILFIHFAQK